MPAPCICICIYTYTVNILSFAEENYTEVGQQISDLAKRNALLSAYSKQCRQLAELYMDLVKQINDKIAICKDVVRCISQHVYLFFFNYVVYNVLG